jgi:hypothetical protein
MSTHDNGLGAIITLKETLPVAMIIGGNPDGLLGIISLQHVLTLHLQGDNQVGERIRIRLTGLSKLDVSRHDWDKLGIINEKEQPENAKRKILLADTHILNCIVKFKVGKT